MSGAKKQPDALLATIYNWATTGKPLTCSHFCKRKKRWPGSRVHGRDCRAAGIYKGDDGKPYCWRHINEHFTPQA